MIITCENCGTRYNLDEKLLAPSGSKVRCSDCKHTFTAFPADGDMVPEAQPPAATAAAEGEVPAPEAVAPADSQGDDLEFSDIEDLLSGSDASGEETGAALDDIALDAPPGAPPAGAAPSASPGLDFTDIEKILDEEDSEGPADLTDLPDTFDLDLPAAPSPGIAARGCRWAGRELVAGEGLEPPTPSASSSALPTAPGLADRLVPTSCVTPFRLPQFRRGFRSRPFNASWGTITLPPRKSTSTSPLRRLSANFRTSGNFLFIPPVEWRSGARRRWPVH